MNISEALANQGTAPIVYMGGTVPGPKWRDRLAGQVRAEFRWFNPIVNEWSPEAQATELEVRSQADVLFYLINPYQEGFYTFAEMTAEAIRSDKPVVVCLLPTYEDKSFSEQQWSSALATKRLLERHNATVLLSIEDAVSWFNNFNPNAVGSRMMDSSSLARAAAEQVAQAPATEEPTPQQKAPPVENQPGVVSPGTTGADMSGDGPVPTTESLGDTLSMEGVFSSLVAFVKGDTIDAPPLTTDAKGKKIYSFSWASQQREEILKTFAKPSWVEHNFKDGAVISKAAVAALNVNGHVTKKPAELMRLLLKQFREASAKYFPKLNAYQAGLEGLEADALKRLKAGEDAEAVAKSTLEKVKALPVPYKDGEKLSPMETKGDSIIHRKGTSIAVRAPKAKENNGKLPELTVADAIEAGKVLIELLAEIDSADIPAPGTGCDTLLWSHDQFEYETGKYSDELYEYFYFQQKPDEIGHVFFHHYYFGTMEALYGIGIWLSKCCGASVTMESAPPVDVVVAQPVMAVAQDDYDDGIQLLVVTDANGTKHSLSRRWDHKAFEVYDELMEFDSPAQRFEYIMRASYAMGE